MKTIFIFILAISFISLKAQVYCPPNSSGANCPDNPTHLNDFNISTPNGRSVSAFNWYPFSTYSCNVIGWLNNIVQQYPNVTILSCPNPNYNCHGYAWNMEFGGSTVAIPNDAIYNYWADDSFYEVFFQPQNMPQQILIFDEKTGKQELAYDVAEAYKGKKIDVKKLSKGVKIVNFLYIKLDSKEAQESLKVGIATAQLERKSDRIVVAD